MHCNAGSSRRLGSRAGADCHRVAEICGRNISVVSPSPAAAPTVRETAPLQRLGLILEEDCDTLVTGSAKNLGIQDERFLQCADYGCIGKTPPYDHLLSVPVRKESVKVQGRQRIIRLEMMTGIWLIHTGGML